MMNNYHVNRFPALLAYLVPILGPLYVFIAHRKDRFALYHAKQSAIIALVALATPLVWLLGGWILSWIPYGFVLTVSLFALVIATYFFLFIAWITGIANVSQTKIKPLPLIGEWGERLPIG
jgi:uncharacterized membrane protein